MTRFSRLSAIPLAPLLVRQARQVRRSTPALPNAAQPWVGSHDGPDPVRLLVLGDSTAAGVGAATQDEALPGCFAREIALRFGRGTRWRAIGANGATARDVLERYMPEAASDPFDLALLTIGANDALTLRSASAFRTDVLSIVGRLREASPGAWIMVSLLPAFEHYEMLPNPLRNALARHADALDRAARRALTGLARVAVMPPPPPYTDDFFASDRFHPGAVGYRLWAEFDFDSAPQVAL